MDYTKSIHDHHKYTIPTTTGGKGDEFCIKRRIYFTTKSITQSPCMQNLVVASISAGKKKEEMNDWGRSMSNTAIDTAKP